MIFSPFIFASIPFYHTFFCLSIRGRGQKDNQAAVNNAVEKREENIRYSQKYQNKSASELVDALVESDSEKEKEWLRERLKNTLPSSDYDKEIERFNSKYSVAGENNKSLAEIQRLESKINGIRDSLENDKKAVELREKKENYYKLAKNPDFAENSKDISAPYIYETRSQKEGTTERVKKYKTRDERGELDNKKYMTDEEQRIYNYLVNTRGNEAAEDFFKSIEPDLNKRMTETKVAKAKELAENNPFAASIDSLGQNLISSGGIVEDIYRRATGQFVDNNSFFNLPSNINKAERSTVAENIEDPVGQWIYGTTMSIADNAINMLVSKGIGKVAGLAGASASTVNNVAANATSIIMGSQVATQTVIDCKDKGLSDGQALGLGLIHGLVEHITEKVSIESILSDPRTFKQALKKSFVSEGSEEVAANWLDRAADALIMGDKSKERQDFENFKAQGMSDIEAFGQVMLGCLGEDAEAFFAGGISGVAMSGTSHAFNAGVKKLEERSANKSLSQTYQAIAKEASKSKDFDEKKKELIEQAKSSGDEKARKMAESFERTIERNGGKLDSIKVEDVGNMLQVLDVGAQKQEVIDSAKNAGDTEVEKMAAGLEEKVKKAGGDYSAVTVWETLDLMKAVENVKQYKSSVGLNTDTTESTESEAKEPTAAESMVKAGGGYEAQEIRDSYTDSGLKSKRIGGVNLNAFGAKYADGIEATSRSDKNVRFQINRIYSSARENNEGFNTVVLETSDGKLVNADEVTLKSTALDTLLRSADYFDTNGARGLLANYEGYEKYCKKNGREADVHEYLKLYRDAYSLGRNNIRYGILKKVGSTRFNSIARAIGIEQAENALNTGANDVDEYFKNENNAVQRLRMPGRRNAADSSVELDVNESFTPGYSDDQVMLLEAVAKKTGRSIVLTDKLESDVNGVFGKDGKIYINANMENSDYMISVALHEAVHGLRDSAPAEYNALEKFVVNYLVESGESVDEMLDDIKTKWKNSAPSEDIRREELVAQTVMALASNERALKTAVECKANRDLLKKALDAIKRIAQGVRTWIEGIKKGDRVTGAHNKQAQPWIEDVKALEKLAKEFSRLMDVQRESVEEHGAENTAGEVNRKSREDFLNYKVQWEDDNSSSLKEQIKAHMDELKKMSVVTEFVFNKQNGDYIQQLKAILKIWNYQINRPDGVSFLFDDKAVSIIRHYVHCDEEAAAVIVAPYVLKRGKIIAGHRNHKNLGSTSITISAPVIINNQRAYVGVTVKSEKKDRVHAIRILDSNGGQFVFDVQKKTKRSTNEVGSKITESYLPSISSSKSIITQSSTNNNTPDIKKSVDDTIYDFKEKQNRIIQRSNPIDDDYHTWIRNAGDIKTFEETLSDSDYNEGEDFDPSYSWDMAQKALKSGKITVYSSYPISQGVFVTPSKMEAEDYAGGGRIFKKTVNLTDVAWIDPTQGQFAKVDEDEKIKHNDLRFAVDDEITDDLFSFDGDLFEEDNTKYLDEFIKTSPQEAVLSMYNSIARAIGIEQAENALNTGANDVDERFKNENNAIQRLRMPGRRNAADSRVELDVNESFTPGYSDDQVMLLEAVAKKTGRSIVLTDKLESNVNGVFGKDGKIYINADMENSDYMISVALHEAVHGLRDSAPAEYNALEKFVVNYLVERGESVDEMLDDIKIKWKQKAPTEGIRREDLVAQTVMALASNERALKTAIECKANRDLLKKALDAIKRIAQGVRTWIEGIKKGDRITGAHNKQAQPWIEDVKALEKLAKLFSKCMDEQRVAVQETTQERNQGGVRYSFGGERARNADKTALATAKQLDADGKSSEEIREIDRYTERQYNNYGWAIVNHVLTGKEQSKLFAQFADKENLNVRYRKSYDGYYMIPVGEYYSYNNKIVFIDGTNQNPIIDRILFVTGDSEYEIGCYVDEVIENEGQLQLLSYIEDYAGKEIFKWNTLSNFETFGRIKEARQRYSTTSSKNTNENRERERGSQERDGFVNKKSIDDTIKDNDLRFAVDDEITDDLFSFDGDLFEEDNTKYLDEFIKTSPQEAVLSMYNSLAKTGESVVRGFKGVKLDEGNYLKAAKRLMKRYQIKQSLNPGIDSEIAQRIKEFVTEVNDNPNANYNEALNVLANDCKSFLLMSGDYDDTGKEIREQILGEIRGSTILLRPYEESQILESFGGMKNLKRAFFGKVNVGYERNKKKGGTYRYIEELVEHIREKLGKAYADESAEDSFEGWKWLDNMLNNVLQPKIINPYLDGEMSVVKSIDSAAAEMALDITNELITEKTTAAAKSKSADKKLITELRKKEKSAASAQRAMSRAKIEKFKTIAREEKKKRIELSEHYSDRLNDSERKRIEQNRRYREWINSVKDQNRSYRNLIFDETTTIRERYVEAREKVRYRKLLAKEYERMVKRLDGKANNNEYIPERLKAPIKNLLELFEVVPEDGKNLPGYWAQYRNLKDVGQRIEDVFKQYSSLSKEMSDNYQIGDSYNADALAYDRAVEAALEEMSELVKGKNVYSMSAEQLRLVYEGMKMLDTQLRRAVEVIVDGKRTYIKELAEKAVDEVQSVHFNKGSGIMDLRNAAIATHLDPVRYGRFLSGYNEDAVIYKLFKDLHEGDKKRVRIMHKAFTELQRTLNSEFSNKELKALQTEDVEDFDFRDKNTGKRVGISRAVLLSIYLTDRQADGHRQLVNEKANHYTRLPDLKLMNRDKKPVVGDTYSSLTKAKQKAAGEKSHEVRFSKYDLEQIRDYVEGDSKLLKLAEAVSSVFNGVIKDEINEVSLQRYGKMIATVKDYFPIKSDPNYAGKRYEVEMGDSVRNWLLQSRGFTKQRVHAENALIIDDVLNVFLRHVQETAEYCGMMIPVENFKRVYGKGNDDVILSKALRDKFGSSANHYIAKLMDDIQAPKNTLDENFLTRLHGNYMGAVLMINPGSAIKQFAALPTAFKYFGISNVAKAPAVSLAKGKQLVEKYSKYTPYMWYRENGNGTIVAETSKQLGFTRKFSDWLDLMGKTDRFVVNSLLYAAEQHVKKTTELEFDSEEFNKEVARQFEQAIDESQPNNMVTSKPQFVRNKVLRMLSLNAFLSQNMAMGNGIIDSGMELAARIHDNKVNKTADSKKAVRAAAVKFARHIIGVLLSGALLGLLNSLPILIIYHKWDDTKDEEGKTSLAKIAEKYVNDSLEAIAGAFAQGDYLYGTIKTLISGEGDITKLEVMSLGTINDLAENVKKGDYWKAAALVSDALGIPIPFGNNVQRLWRSAASYVTDLKDGNTLPAGLDNHTIVKNNGKLDTDNIGYYVADYVRSGNKKEAEKYINLWKGELMNQGKSEDEATQNIKNKLADVLAKTDDDVTDAFVAYTNGDFKKYDALYEKLHGYGFDQSDVEKAVNKVKKLIFKAMKDAGVESDEAKDDLIAQGFNEKAAGELAEEYNKEPEKQPDDVLSDSGEGKKYKKADAFKAFASGDKEAYEDIKEYLVEKGKVEDGEKLDKDMQSMTYTGELIDSYLKALDAEYKDKSQKENREELKKQLLNIYGSWDKASAAIKKRQKQKQKK